MFLIKIIPLNVNSVLHPILFLNRRKVQSVQEKKKVEQKRKSNYTSFYLFSYNMDLKEDNKIKIF